MNDQEVSQAELAAKDAALLFRLYRENWNRDPSKLTMTWAVEVQLDREVPETEVESLLNQMMLPVIDDLGFAEMQTDIHVEEDSTIIQIQMKGMLSEEKIAALHQCLERFCQPEGRHYMGVDAWLHDENRDVEELFGKWTHIRGWDPREKALIWKFYFAGDDSVDEAIIPLFMQRLHSQFPDGSPNPTGSFDQNDEGQTMFSVSMLDTMQPQQLVELHEHFQRMAQENELDYLGVNPEEPAPELSTEEGVRWVDEVLQVSAKWKLAQLPQVEQKIRQHHLEALAEAQMSAADWMPLIRQRFDLTLRPKEEIVRRLMATFAVMAYVCAPEAAIPEAAIRSYLASNPFASTDFSEREKYWLAHPRDQVREFAGEAGWIVENLWSLAWILGYKPTPNPSSMELQSLVTPIRDQILRNLDRNFEQLMKITKLRRIEKILTLEDLLYCAHNAYRNQGWVQAAGLVQERRMPLTWALSPGTPWDDTDVST